MQSINNIYNPRFFIWGLVFIALICAVMKVSNGAGFALIVIPVLIGLTKNKAEILLYCILLTAVLTITNVNIAPKAAVYGLLSRGVYIMIAGVLLMQNVGRPLSKYVVPLLSILLYCAFQAIASASGFCPPISYLKLILFVLVFTAYFQIANTTSFKFETDPRTIRSIFLVVATFLIFGSIALLPFPAISQLTAGSFLANGGSVEDFIRIQEGGISLFTGITFQSQTLGPAMAALGSLLLADWLFSIRKWNWLYALLFFCTPFLVYKTSSRTAMGTMLAGLLFVMLCFVQSRGVGAVWKQRVLSIALVLGLIGTLGFFATPSLRGKVLNFVYKTSDSSRVADKSLSGAIMSRQGLIDVAFENFKASPVIGNGFQVSEQMRNLKITDYKQLLSAPIEKGVWIYAVLEEGGVIGMAFFVLFLIVSFWCLLSRHAYLGAAALFVLTVSNFGEFTFFSMSANGGLMWALIFMGLSMDIQRMKPVRRYIPVEQPGMLDDLNLGV